MRVLAIDTALEACSAAVFDTSSGIAATETRGMARGHAEQLMPLIARGIALAAAKPAIGLSTLAGFAAPLIAADDGTQIVAAIDARHEHIYLQVFGVNGRTLVAPRMAPVRDAIRAAMSAPARIIGSGAKKVAAAWPKGAEPPLSVEQRGAPDIDWIARLGAAAPEARGAPKPLYLREPDARPQAGARLPRR